MKKGYKAVIHFECGEPAFLAVEQHWDNTTPVTADKLRHLKGRIKYNDQTKIVCETCGVNIYDLSLTHDNHIVAISTNDGYRDYWTQFREIDEKNQLTNQLKVGLKNLLDQRKDK